MRLKVFRLELRELFVLDNGQSQHLAGLRALHVAERAEVNLAQQSVGSKVIGIFLDLILRSADGLANTADAKIRVGEPILQIFGGGIGVEGELVLFDGLGGVVGTAVVDSQLLIEVGKAIVVVG